MSIRVVFCVMIQQVPFFTVLLFVWLMSPFFVRLLFAKRPTSRFPIILFFGRLMLCSNRLTGFRPAEGMSHALWGQSSQYATVAKNIAWFLPLFVSTVFQFAKFFAWQSIVVGAAAHTCT